MRRDKLEPFEATEGVRVREHAASAATGAVAVGSAEDGYLTHQLIAYIGNKRRLLPFLGAAFRELASRAEIRTFLDPFAGSGSVARLAKTLGFAVQANDWEMYSWVVTSAHVAVQRSALDRLFDGRGEELFDHLTRLGQSGPAPRDPYLSRTYAPKSTDTADYRTERLFYTRENALFLDRVREWIEDRYPGWDLERPRLTEKILLISSLLYEAATHANTSGVFKACHKGFGGFGRDALGRILSPMELEPPLLVEGSQPCVVTRREAADFVAERTADLCYLDPPYNSHQYGSNYHLLNTIALWDRPTVSNALRPDGRLADKAAIRKDWVETRSDFCYADRARSAFERLLDRVDSRYIALSYNTEGILPFEELSELLARRGRVELLGTDYVKYPGGKQSLHRRTHNLEFLAVVTTGERLRPSDRTTQRRQLAERRVGLLLRSSFHPGRVRDEFEVSGETVRVPGGTVRLPMRHLHFFLPGDAGERLRSLSDRELAALEERLLRCQCESRAEEAEVLMELLASRARADSAGRESAALQIRLARVVRKFAHRRYRCELERACAAVDRLISSAPGRFQRLARELEAIRGIAALRFAG